MAITISKLIKSRIGVFDHQSFLLFEVPRISGNHPRTIKRILAKQNIHTPYKAVQARYGYQWAWVPSEQ